MSTAHPSAAFVYQPALAEGKLRPSHPLKLARVRTCFELLSASGVFNSGAARVVPPQPAAVSDVLRVHTPEYVRLVQALSANPERADGDLAAEAIQHGLAPEGDTPPYAGMFEYQLLVSGASIEAVRLVDAGEARAAMNAAGGVNHHAMPGQGSGFGLFNDTAVAIDWLRQRGRRVMYVDLDVHHGDGVEATFAQDPNVLTVSLHESTRYLFPGPKGGFPENVGAGPGRGFSVNVPFAPYTGDATWLWAFEEVVPPLYHAFRPDLLLVQLGADGYFADPLAHLLLTEHAYLTAVRRLVELAGGRLAAVGGGGYDAQAAPRIWAAEFHLLAGLDVPDDLATPTDDVPQVDAQTEEVTRRFAAQSVATIKELVFPILGATAPS
jgi:acetoin utilization protein AcuC